MSRLHCWFLEHSFWGSLCITLIILSNDITIHITTIWIWIAHFRPISWRRLKLKFHSFLAATSIGFCFDWICLYDSLRDNQVAGLSPQFPSLDCSLSFCNSLLDTDHLLVLKIIRAIKIDNCLLYLLVYILLLGIISIVHE